MLKIRTFANEVQRTRTMQMRLPSTRKMPNEVAKHKNNDKTRLLNTSKITNEVAKHKNNANDLAEHKNKANEDAK